MFNSLFLTLLFSIIAGDMYNYDENEYKFYANLYIFDYKNKIPVDFESFVGNSGNSNATEDCDMFDEECLNRTFEFQRKTFLKKVVLEHEEKCIKECCQVANITITETDLYRLTIDHCGELQKSYPPCTALNYTEGVYPSCCPRLVCPPYFSYLDAYMYTFSLIISKGEAPLIYGIYLPSSLSTEVDLDATEALLEKNTNYYSLGVAVCGFGGIVSLITLIISMLSWTIIPKWRTFKNYVFLNIIFAFNAIYCVLISDFFSKQKLIFIALDVVMNFFMFASWCWLMVMAMIFYTDLVKVFGNTITRKVLKSNVFGWGLPIIVTIGKVINKTIILSYNKKLPMDDDEYFYYEKIVQNIVMIILLGLNFSVYIRVVYSLMRSSNIRRSGNRAQKVLVATLAFIMSGILLMGSIMMTIIMLVGENKYDLVKYYPFVLAIFGVNTTVINICFLMLKANRDIWNKFLETLSKRAERQQNNEHEMFDDVALDK